MSDSPSVLAIQIYYQKLGLQDKWNERRVKRLCGYLRITERELSALLGISEDTFFRQLASRRIFHPACILLTILEDFLIGEYVDDTIPNVLSGALKNGKSRHSKEVRLHAR